MPARRFIPVLAHGADRAARGLRRAACGARRAVCGTAVLLVVLVVLIMAPVVLRIRRAALGARRAARRKARVSFSVPIGKKDRPQGSLAWIRSVFMASVLTLVTT